MSLTQLFVYGNLREGKKWWPMMSNHGAVKVDEGYISGFAEYLIGETALIVEAHPGMTFGEVMVVDQDLLKRVETLGGSFQLREAFFCSSNQPWGQAYPVLTLAWPNKIPDNATRVLGKSA